MYGGQLRKIYFKLVIRAIMIFTSMPNTMINAAVVPYCSSAIDMIASLLGTTPAHQMHVGKFYQMVLMIALLH